MQPAGQDRFSIADSKAAAACYKQCTCADLKPGFVGSAVITEKGEALCKHACGCVDRSRSYCGGAKSLRYQLLHEHPRANIGICQAPCAAERGSTY